jgi:hypothetical protein
MGLFRKKSDPIDQSQQALEARIAALRNEIRALNENPAAAPPAGKRRRTSAAEPTFEVVDHGRVQGAPEPTDSKAHFNELGVRKYDPIATLRRWITQMRSRPAANPKLVNYLAAGSIHGLRPLRYEKRIARRRFFALLTFFLAILWGLVYIYSKNH